MSEKHWTEEQRIAGFRALTIAYLGMGAESHDDLTKAADLFQDMAMEYQRRMTFMGMSAIPVAN